MTKNERRANSLRIDFQSVLRPFEDERIFFQKLRQSTSFETILFQLFDLLKTEDYRRLFSTLNRKCLTLKCLEIFSQLLMQRYLEIDRPICEKTTNEEEKLVDQYKKSLFDEFQSKFSIHFFHAILFELEQLNEFKIDQISKCLYENNRLIENLFESSSSSTNQDDGIIHISSTPAQPIYLPYKPIHLVEIRTKVFINTNSNNSWPSEGLTHVFIADLTQTKRTTIFDPLTNRTHEIATKSIYFAEPCQSNVLLILKLRVWILKTRRFGIVGEEAGKNNQYRCLIFYLDEEKNLEANYFRPDELHLCFDQNFSLNEFENESNFLLHYFKLYPERMMLRVKEKTLVKIRSKTSTNVFQPAIVLQIDSSMIFIELSQTKERRWIYRGSKLIEQMKNYYAVQNDGEKQPFGRHSARQHLSARKSNAPEIICLNDQMKLKTNRLSENDENQKTTKRSRISAENDAEKSVAVRQGETNSSTIVPCRTHNNNPNGKIVIDPVFFELAEQSLLHHPVDFFSHQCSYRCVFQAEKYFHQLPRTMNPYLKPFACQWSILENIRIRKANDSRLKISRPMIIYCSPCGKKLCNEAQVDQYLHQTKSKLPIDLFIFDSSINLKQWFSTDGRLITSDISDGQENVPICAVNEVDDDQPANFTYRVERTPVDGVPLVLNEPTMTCCSCTDGCRNRSQCACWLRTLKYAELVGDERVKSMKAKQKSQAEILYQLGYGFRRLFKNVPGGIYECNSRCSCHQQTCSNRLVQNGISVQLQLFKTAGRGWGVRTLHDIPLGTFISVYSGEIFTSEQADERGKLIGDEYQADLDFFENINEDSDESESESDRDENESGEENKAPTNSSSTRRRRQSTIQLRSRDSSAQKKTKSTIEENMNNTMLNRTLLPDYDGVVYTLDAKLVGNVGRYFNHSCSPNLVVQNVFVDTHDIHFPWIAFFTTKNVRAGTELCWDYNYTVGEIAGRRMDCNCGSSECRRRVL